MKPLATPITEMGFHYDVVIVGSGYGGGIAASRMARCGKAVCLLERGKEILTGEYPDTIIEASGEFQLDLKGVHLGSPTGLYDMRINDDINVFVGCGLGGTSLINANVSLRADERVFEDPRWPPELRGDASLEEGYARAVRMLAPTPYPNDKPLNKLKALEQAAEALGAPCERPPINVTFGDDKTNHANVVQPGCTLCGDCCAGCNVGAKNTVLVNYLPDAVNHGAEIFTEVKVRYVKKNGDGWTVYFEPQNLERDDFDAPELFVSADIVILAAGTLGSTEILLRSKERGLALSDMLGKRFTGNGDVLAFGYNNDVPIDGVGFGEPPKVETPPVGPCITGVIDMRDTDKVTDGMVIEEGSLPSALAPILPIIMAGGSAAFGKDTDHGLADFLRERARDLESLAGGAYRGAVNHTQTFLAMSHDDGGGEMRLEDDRIRVDWPDVASQPIFETIDQRLFKSTEATGGTYLKNPMSSTVLGENLVTVHPLGGCVMGASKDDGVVNHKSQVFDGAATAEPGKVHEGLHVCDGAIVPTPLGVNPLLTISALAERAMIHLAGDRGWTFDDEAKLDAERRHAAASDAASSNAGVRFTERMAGYFSTEVTDNYDSAAKAGRDADSPLEFTFTIIVDDVEGFIDDKQHAAKMLGTVTVPALSDRPLTATGGTFNLFVVDPAEAKTKRMEYRIKLTAEDGAEYRFEGFKIIRDDPGLDLWGDTTTLYVDIYEGAAADGSLKGKGILKIALIDFLRQTTTLKAINGKGTKDRLEAVAAFGLFFGGELFNAYRGLATKPSRQPAKRKIPLYTLEGVPDARVSTHYFTTEDKLGLSMIRFRRGDGDDAVLIIHGLTTSTDMFIMPEHKNLVSYLLDNGFGDVWCLDYRMSNRHSYNLRRHRFNMDDIALFDYPPAIETIKQHIGARRLHVICHCLGSASFTMSLFGGAVDGISSVIANSVALTPKVPTWSHIKLYLAPFFVEQILSVAYIDPRGSNDPGLTRGKMLSKVVSLFHRECDVPACHMLSLLWGTGWPALYNHKNLATVTHERGGDLYGGTAVHYFRHVRAMVRAGNTAVKYEKGNPKYDRLPDNYFERAAEMKTPVLFMTGKENRVFADSNIECHRRLEEIVPGRHELLVIPGYGHQDVFMGNNVHRDVFPHFLRFLNEHRT